MRIGLCEHNSLSPKSKKRWEQRGEENQSLRFFFHLNVWLPYFREAFLWIRRNFSCHCMRTTLHFCKALTIQSSTKLIDNIVYYAGEETCFHRHSAPSKWFLRHGVAVAAWRAQLTEREDKKHAIFRLGYTCSLTKYVAHSEQQKPSRAVEILKEKKKIFITGICGEMVFSRWRCAKATKIGHCGFTHLIGDDGLDCLRVNLVFFSEKKSVCVFIGIMRYLSEFKSESGVEINFVE